MMILIIIIFSVTRSLTFIAVCSCRHLTIDQEREKNKKQQFHFAVWVQEGRARLLTSCFVLFISEGGD